MVILCVILTPFCVAAAPNGVDVVDYDRSTNYMSLMIAAAEDGSPYALHMGAIYEIQRNMKIEQEGISSLELTDLFWMENPTEILKQLNLHNKDKADLIYNEEEARILTTMLCIECGHCPIEMIECTAMVAVNRKLSNYSSFANTNTIYEVITAPGQYNPSYADRNSKYYQRATTEMDANGNLYWDTCYDVAIRALTGQIDIPENVLYQSNYSSLGVYNEEYKSKYYKVCYYNGVPSYYSFGC